MKKTFSFFLLLSFAVSAFAQNSRMIADIKSHTDGMAVWWAGHNSWIIKSGNLVVTTDLWLENGSRMAPAPITPEEMASVIDVSFVTHAHGDHFNEYTSKVLLEQSDCIFVMPESCLAAAKKLGIPDQRIVVAKPREPFEVKGIKVEPIRALHGNANFAIYYEANLQDCGYVLNINGKRFLQPGDSYLLEDHLFAKDIDVLFFSPTEHNMYIDRSTILINALQPDYIFPQHHSTVKVSEENRFWAKGYPEEVKIWIDDELKNRYHVFEIGEKKLIR
ncbi:MBL fold metallo-hydrolase [uncultured Imperialibacter sp.]|uniref:MBL fold metallo-hydrolase n=1 Tax=uncultured Imperialibacter sp. TaxID=1672639 RepID=UPI0030DBD5E7|tara:strand:+ start:19491 stop:20318 length:828 start_codon:yes stop_codon:yes gene_type:complete